MTAPQRVAFVTTSYPSGAGDPSGHFVEAEAEARALAGDDVTVIAPRTPSAGLFPPAASSRLRIEWLPGGDAFGPPGALERLRHDGTRVLGALAFVRAARAALRRKGPFDAVVAHWLVPSAWPIATRDAARLEVVVHGSDVRVLEQLPIRMATHIVGSLWSNGARFRFVSRDLRRRLTSRTGIRELALSTVEPAAVDCRGAPSRVEARARLGVAETERLAVIVSRLVADKRVPVAVRWARERAARVVVIGDGPERRALASAGVQLLGPLPRPETLAWIAAADCLVSASRAEGAPTVVREARQLGVPVVTAPCGDVREWAASDPGITVIDDPAAAITRGSGA